MHNQPLNPPEIYAMFLSIADHTKISLILFNKSIEEDFYLTDISQDEIISYIEAENIDLDEFEDELLIF